MIVQPQLGLLRHDLIRPRTRPSFDLHVQPGFNHILTSTVIGIFIAYAWTNETFDEDFHDAARSSAEALFDAAVSEGQSLPGIPSHMIYATYTNSISLADSYGSNLTKLRSLQLKGDRHNVVALASGCKF